MNYIQQKKWNDTLLFKPMPKVLIEKKTNFASFGFETFKKKNFIIFVQFLFSFRFRVYHHIDLWCKMWNILIPLFLEGVQKSVFILCVK